MRRSAICLFVVAAAALGCVGSAFARSTELQLTESGEPGFPDRSYLLSLPSGTQVRPDQIRLHEDGQRIAEVSAVAASAASARGFGVVLVIDTSRSMKGEPIRDAMAAARAFAKRRNPRQQLGVVMFNGDTVVALPLTQDAAEIERALTPIPQLGRNTHVFDAVGQAVGMLRTERLKPASVVVLSDGSDTGSRTSAAQVSAQARKNGVRVFSVGLRSGAFDAGTLADLARATHGIYDEARRPGDLGHIFDELGRRLASEYLLTYRSLAGPNHRVRVQVSVDGVPGTASAAYKTPALRTELPPYNTSSFWSSPAAMFLVSLACGLLLVATGYFLFSRPARRSLRRRVTQFVSPPPVEASENGDAHVTLTSPGLLMRVARPLEGMRRWPEFEESLDVARIAMPANQVVGGTIITTLLVTMLIGMVTGSALFALLALLLPLVVRRVVIFKLARERKRFGEQLADNLQVIASALRAGYSLVGAMAISVDDAPEPTKREFERVVADEKLGVPLDEGLSVVARRMKSRDLEQLMLVASLQRETGGNTAEVLDRVADTVRERADVRRMVQTLTAQGRISRWIVSALPVGLALAIMAINPAYLDPLFKTPAGHAMLVLAVLFLFAGSAVIKKIVTIEV
jgi:tight adherence protein B